MSVLYLFIVDFEGNSLLRLPKTATESLKKTALKAEKLCLQNCKQPLSTFNQPLKRKAQNFLMFGKKNQNSTLVGFITSADYKPKDRAWQYIDKCFDLIKTINSDDFLIFESYQEEFVYIINKACVNKNMSNTENLIKGQIDTIEKKIIPNAQQDLIDIQGINIKTKKMKKKAQKLHENSSSIQQEAREYHKGVQYFIYGLLGITFILGSLYLINVVT